MSCFENPLSPSLEKDLEWNYEMLVKTSRSFALVIKALGNELKDAVMVFYLVLRGLDTVEDDAAFPKDKKLPLLINFYQNLTNPKWNLVGCGENENEKTLLEHFDRVNRIFINLKPKFREVISDITKRMGKGMSEFIQREIINVEDWDLYCHYVAGLVGIGLSGLFANSGLEDPKFATWDKISNSMGLFLQKTNIIRDYREDIDQKRIFWPRSIWSLYCEKLEDFKEDQHTQKAVYCLNHLITNAFEHIPDCLDYMSRIQDPNIFNFCAIPQVMAISTLALCYNNHDIFIQNVKIKQEETMLIGKTIATHGLSAVHSWFYYYLGVVEKKAPSHDPNYTKFLKIISQSKSIIEKSNIKLISISEGKL